MIKKPLAILIAAILGAPVVAAPSDLTFHDIGQMTIERLKEIKTLADQGTGVFERDGKQFIRYKGIDYALSYKNDIKFPFLPYDGGDDSAYRNVIDFVGSNWHFQMYDGGFYLMNKAFDAFNNDETGCYIEYVPSSHGSQRPDGSFIERDTTYRIETSDCGDVNVPAVNVFKLASISDQSAAFEWFAQQDGDNATLTLTNTANAADIRRYEQVSSGFFIDNLTPETTYQATLDVCNAIACTRQEVLSVTTLDTRVGFADEIPVKNHLIGSLAGSLSFTQTHTSVAPNGNEFTGQGHLDAIMNREALLLFTPQSTSQGSSQGSQEINQLWAEIYQDGNLVARRPMAPPSALNGTDQPDNGRMKVVYSHKAWSLLMQWDWMKPGMSLKLMDNQGREGELTATLMTFGGAPELVIKNIDIGLLTAPRGKNTMNQELAKLTADYYQKIPVSKLVIADYTPLHVEKVTMPDGTVYTEKSAGQGTWHDGDMREMVSGVLVSTGMSNANVGVFVTQGNDGRYNRRGNHIVTNTSVGVYTKEGTDEAQVVVHGGNAGGGRAWLEHTIGNEWSHELGHTWGLKHWPYMASLHDMESGWGWDAYHRRFIGNMHWREPATTMVSKDGDDVVPPFKDEFRFLRDAHNGGEPAYVGTISRYTLEHPAQTRKAQISLNQGLNLDSDSPSGYTTWDHSAQQYRPADVDAPKPQQTGVPVVTVLGFYDPENKNPSQIYPLIYSNYGNLFELPQPESFNDPVNGWQSIATLTAEQLNQDMWQTYLVDGEQVRLCKFTYTHERGDTATLVGSLNEQANVCEMSQDMKWHGDNTIASRPNEFELLSRLGEGAVTYVPTPEIGEVQLCTLNKPEASGRHDGAGFVRDGRCDQIPGMKSTASNGTWRYYIDSSVLTRKYDLQCTLTVTRNDGSVEQAALAGYRLYSLQSNKFHINLPMRSLPKDVAVACHAGGKDIPLDHMIPDQNPPIDKLQGPVIMGQEHGYTQVAAQTLTLAERDGLISQDFGSMAEFEAFLQKQNGVGRINNGVTLQARHAGAWYVLANPQTGTRDYFVMLDERAGAMPVDQRTNDSWKFLGSADDYVNLDFNPITFDRRDGISSAERVKTYFEQERLLTWAERHTTKWGQSEQAVFVSDADENGEHNYFIQKRPGEGEPFPNAGQSSADWYYIGSDTSIAERVEELKSHEAFEKSILAWYKQDEIGYADISHNFGTVGDIYGHYRDKKYYFRLESKRFGYYPNPNSDKPYNSFWTFIGHH